MSKVSAQNLNSALKITQAAKLLGISRSTLLRLEESGKISSKRLSNGYRVFENSAILELKGRLELEKQSELLSKIVVKSTSAISQPKPAIKPVITTKKPALTPSPTIDEDIAPEGVEIVQPAYEPANYHLTHLAQRPPKGLNFDFLIRNLIKSTIGLSLVTALLITVSFLKGNLSTVADLSGGLSFDNFVSSMSRGLLFFVIRKSTSCLSLSLR